MKHTELAEKALGVTFTEEQLFERAGGTPDELRITDDGEAVVWVYGKQNDDGEWSIAKLAKTNPSAPTDKLAKMWAEPIEDGYQIVRGCAVDQSMWDDPFGEEVRL